MRSLARVRLLWDCLREALEVNRDFLMGEARTLTAPALRLQYRIAIDVVGNVTLS